MKILNLLFLVCYYTVCSGQTYNDKEGDALFKIKRNDKIGFINIIGQEIIKPVFWSAGDFSEGLASARIDGSYGYIDKTGKFVIQAQFDYAMPFSEGLAVVYKDSIPFVIDKNSKKAFDSKFSSIEKFENGRALVKTKSNKFGFINKKGKLFIDTVYTNIYKFSNGLAVVEGLHHINDVMKGKKGVYEIGVIDTLGKFIINYRKYEYILDFDNGHFMVGFPPEPWDSIQGYSAMTAIMDRTGKIQILKDEKQKYQVAGGFKNFVNGSSFNDGLAKVYIYKYWDSEGPDFNAHTYDGFINLKGEIIINDTTFKSAKDFSNNRAVVVIDDSHSNFIINTKGQVINKKPYTEILGEGFKNGTAFVEQDSKWGLIDTNANFIIKPQFENINRLGMIDDYFFYTHRNNANRELTGIANNDGSILFQPILQEFDQRGFHNGLLKCVIDDKSTYINKKGIIVWQELNNDSMPSHNLNIGFINRGYSHNSDPYGISSSLTRIYNLPKETLKSLALPLNCISVQAFPDVKILISDHYNGMLFIVSNNSNTKIDLNAVNDDLYFRIQALNKKEEWKYIEYASIYREWCGQDYQTLSMEPNSFWTFKTITYEGGFKTKFRIELIYLDPNGKTEAPEPDKEISIYSNEYEGYINPGQFWREQDE